MENTHQKPHAVMFPYPLQGHVIPFVRLAMKLASNGFIITLVNTQAIHHQISKAHNHGDEEDIFIEARKSGLDIRYTTVSDGFPIEFDRSLNHDQFFEGILHGFSAHVDELVGKLVLSDPPVNSLIADTFYVWPSMVARKYNLVNISFWTEPALVFTLYYHMDLLRKNGQESCNDDNCEDVIDYIPGVQAIKPTDLTSYLQATDKSTIVHRTIDKAFEDVKKADFVICNTVQELESETILALKQPFYAIGPIFPTSFTKNSVSTSLWSESDCTQWLDTKPQGSVLYVSFGSYAHTNKQNITQIAYGLLLSGVDFIWVLRPDIISSNETDFLPTGYQDCIKGRGLIVPWCCQIAVLNHSAVGGFFTHCGWNSTLESIWFSVPMICFPLLTDQFSNRKLVVDDWRIGINLCDRKSITSEEVAENIKILMTGKISDELRQEIKKVKNTLENAVATDGSSQKNFNKFIKDVEVKIPKSNGVFLEK